MTTESWRRRSEIPLVVAAALFSAAYAWQVLDPNISAGWRLICDVVLWSTWVLFAIEYVTRLWLAEYRGQHFVRHLPDLAIVALPGLRPLRLLRVVAFVGVLQHIAGRSLRGRVSIYVAGTTILIIFLAALAVLDAEQGAPDTQITNFGDAIWWSVVSTTTVGYGDLYPVTIIGRLIAISLMITAIALLGTVTANIASWLVENVRDQHEGQQSEIELLTAEVRELRNALAEQQRESAPVGASRSLR